MRCNIPIQVLWDTPKGYLNAAANSGEFATQRANLEDELRTQSFANDAARGAAGFALGGLGQAFQQRQQLNDQAFRQQQADQQNAFRQQDFDANQQFRNDTLGAGLERANIQAGAGIDRAALQGQYGLQREGLRQGAMDDRADEGNQLKLILQQNNIDWRTANAAQVQQARQALQQMRGQQAGQLEQQRFQNRGALQDDQQDFTGGQNYLNRQQRQTQFDQRRQDQQNNPAAGFRLGMQEWNGQRIMLSTQAGMLLNQIHALQQQARESTLDPSDPLGRAKLATPRALEAQQQIPSLMQRLEQLNQQMNSLGPPPDVSQVYGQLPPQDFNPNLPDENTPTVPNPGYAPDPQMQAMAAQMVADLKAQGVTDPQAIRQMVAQQLGLQ